VSADGRRRSILLVAYFYPPCRDTGAQRPASMARHLARKGNDVTVLTTSAFGWEPTTASASSAAERGAAALAGEPADQPRGSVTSIGPSAIEVAGGATPGEPGTVKVIRTPDLQRVRARLRGGGRVGSMFDADSYSGRPHPLSHVLVPEPLIVAWAPFALVRARRTASRQPPDCAITTSPPESAHLVGRMLSRQGIPWIADLRDGWSFERLRPEFPTAAQRRLDLGLERRWLGDADVVSCVSRPVADDLRDRGIADPIVVPNGWDPSSSQAAVSTEPPRLDPDRVSLVYTGRFGSYGRDPRSLVAALGQLAQSEPAAAERLELAIAGPLTESERLLFATDVSPARISVLGSLERPAALALQRSADALLVLASPKRTQLANLKLYEYLAAGPPILALAAGTEAGRIAAEAGCTVVPSDDVTAIQSALRDLAQDGLAPPDPASRERYTYPAVADRMAEAVELAIERGTRAV
jgi:glycosyltransferase involved in cell wall biosynthesis